MSDNRRTPGNFNRIEFLNKTKVDGIENIDFFSIDILKLMKYLDKGNYRTYQYNGTEPIENISYKFYGATNLWWILVEYNGIIDPLEIPEGTILRVPFASDVNKAISTKILGKRTGERVRV